MTNLRWIAAKVIDEVAEGRSLSDSLQHALQTINENRDKAFVQALCYGVCRYYTRLDAILAQLLQKPLKAKDHVLHALLLVGLYQLIDMRVKVHAAVSETVNASANLKAPWARSLVNAILREYLRRQAEIDSALTDDEEAVYSHPDWWIKKIKAAWPNDWQMILTANNAHPPFVLRVNQQKISRENYIAKLIDHQIAAKALPTLSSGIVLESPLPIEQLPGFAAGEVSVQDGAAQLAAELLQLSPRQTVLDACAAPGGKLTHLLEIEPNLAEVIAVEKDPARLSTIHENLARLQMQATVICDDVANVGAWSNKKMVDRILLDAPCSASGVIRRHPDIKLLRQATDVPVFANDQKRLLRALWPLLKPDGILLYATCSIFSDENNDVIQAFLSEHADAEEIKLDVDWGMPLTHGRQVLPGMHAMDGFYYAKIKKLSKGKSHGTT
ncbi:MAG: 16S rRNA (cytosine(967)-C(5))-methyltransferase [Gammaproteobacteria bacterium RIFCSPHIGHO2_12_FULL_43_28]|nr:MAG: 16S rRNA (cytosine(967)-C(5))-methyltransferase [Gammaproteobacteria bacterium RIFCSPHIGHO2_12_FULL_43_28]